MSTHSSLVWSVLFSQLCKPRHSFNHIRAPKTPQVNVTARWFSFCAVQRGSDAFVSTTKGPIVLNFSNTGGRRGRMASAFRFLRHGTKNKTHVDASLYRFGRWFSQWWPTNGLKMLAQSQPRDHTKFSFTSICRFGEIAFITV